MSSSSCHSPGIDSRCGHPDLACSASATRLSRVLPAPAAFACATQPSRARPAVERPRGSRRPRPSPSRSRPRSGRNGSTRAQCSSASQLRPDPLDQLEVVRPRPPRGAVSVPGRAPCSAHAPLRRAALLLGLDRRGCASAAPASAASRPPVCRHGARSGTSVPSIRVTVSPMASASVTDALVASRACVLEARQPADRLRREPPVLRPRHRHLAARRSRRAARPSARPSGPRSNPCRSAPSARSRRPRGTRPPPS